MLNKKAHHYHRMIDHHKIHVIEELDLSQIPEGTLVRLWLNLVEDGVGLPIHVPLLVARGVQTGPVFGVTAALHGNELNGISLVQRLFKQIDLQQLKGTIIGVPVLNIPSLIRNKRRFIDGIDLNHIMPGDPSGSVSQVYAWRIMDRIVKKFDYLIDIHTASNGRINSFYARADMNNPRVKKMTALLNPQVILHNPPNDKTLRGAADELGIPAVTIELGDPNLFQKDIVRNGLSGVMDVLHDIGMHPATMGDKEQEDSVICKDSYWIYSDIGGFLNVHPRLTEMVKKGQLIATMKNIFGDIVREYTAPEDGIVIGKSVQPINHTGGRILHLGILREQQE